MGARSVHYSLSLWPHQAVRTRTTVSGICVLWEGTTFNSSWPKWEMVWTVIIRLYQTVTLEVVLELNNWTRCQNLATIPMPVMRHMREVTSSKSPTRRECLHCQNVYCEDTQEISVSIWSKNFVMLNQWCSFLMHTAYFQSWPNHARHCLQTGAQSIWR